MLNQKDLIKKVKDYNKFLKGDTHRNMAKGFIDLTTVTSVDINTDYDLDLAEHILLGRRRKS